MQITQSVLSANTRIIKLSTLKTQVWKPYIYTIKKVKPSNLRQYLILNLSW
jgi:hypothetical protein